jgi:hypothetical protein
MSNIAKTTRVKMQLWRAEHLAAPQAAAKTARSAARPPISPHAPQEHELAAVEQIEVRRVLAFLIS